MHIKIHAKTGAKREAVRTISADQLEISVTEPAERGRANRRILKLLRQLHPGRPIRMVSGQHSPHKIVSL